MNKPDHEEQSDLKRRRSDHARLDSWKAIARYFDRSVRTVRRWESQEQLPVHRHKHAKGFSVYAYTAELDSWKRKLGRQASTQIESDDAVKDSSQKQGRSRHRLYLIGAVACVAIFLAGMFLNFRIAPDSGRDAARPVTLLVGAAENFGDQQDVGEKFVGALRRELSKFEGNRIASPKLVRHTLRLMRRDTDTKLSAPVAIEIAQRSGDIDIFIRPQIERWGDTYILSANIIDATNGESIGFPSVEVDDLSSIAFSMDRLADNVQTTIREQFRSAKMQPMPSVSTQSFAALRLYTRALAALRAGKSRIGDDLLRAALDQDPEFASALALRAWTMRENGASDADYLPFVKLAASHSGLPDSEQFFIDGIEHHFSGNFLGAAEMYKLLLDENSDHFIGAHAILELCMARDGFDKCVHEHVAHALLRPDHFEANLQAAQSIIAAGDETEKSLLFAQRAREILARDGFNEYPLDSITQALLFPAIAAWIGGNVQTALHLSRELHSGISAYPAAVQSDLLPRLATFSLMLGRVSESRSLSLSIRDPERHHEVAASILFASRDIEKLKLHLAEYRPYGGNLTVLLEAIIGVPKYIDSDREPALISYLSKAQIEVVNALRAAKSGDPETATSILRDAVVDLTAEDEAYLFVGQDMLSKLFLDKGELDNAIAVLEQTTVQKSVAALNDSGLFWMLCQNQLAQLYHRANRDDEALEIEIQLRDLLSEAENDFPLAAELSITS